MILRLRYIVTPIVLFVVALTVFVVLVVSSLSSTQSSEHVDHEQIQKIERYIDKQIQGSKGCSSVPKNPSLRLRCEETIDGVIDSLDPVERRALANAIAPYIH